MLLSRFLFGGRKDLAAAFANGQAWPKVMTIPLLYEMNGLLNVHLLNAGSKLMNVNGSVTPVVFEYVVPANYFLGLAELDLMIVDGAMTIEKFGGIAGPLTNGILWRIVDENDVDVYNFVPDNAIKRNWDFFHVAGASLQLGAGQDFMHITWNSQILGILAVLRPGWKIQIVVRDDLTSITSFEASVTAALIPDDVQFVYSD